MVRTKVFVGNLSFQTQEAELAAEFGNAGKVISANIITRGPRSLGYGFVEMDSEEDAHNAVKVMSKKEINGREINVEIAKPQDESKVRQPRPKVEGETSPRRRPRRRPAKKDRPEGTQAPQTQKKESKEEESENKEDERPRRQRNRRGRGAPGQKRVISEENREESKTTLFVANLPFSLDDEGFAKIITDLSLKLKTAHVVKKRNGRSKGYGFVEFDTEEDQQKALTALNKKVVDNRELSVKVALTELKREEQQEEKKEGAAKPAEKKAAPAEKKVAPAEKKAVPAEKKAAPAEKKAAPAEKKAVPAEKKAASPATVPAEKKAASPAPVPAEKKAAPAEKKTSPAPEKKVATPEKKAVPAEKKTATPEKKDEKK